MQSNLNKRIAGLEDRAGVGSEFPKLIIVGTFGAKDDDLQHAFVDGKEGRVEIQRKTGESIEDFKRRAVELGSINPRRIPWMY